MYNLHVIDDSFTNAGQSSGQKLRTIADDVRDTIDNVTQANLVYVDKLPPCREILT